MNDDQLLRYSRHILLDEIGIEGQQKMLASRVLIVGAGGLGCPAALYLASAGVGHITIVDDDRVDATNLQRQIAHTVDRVGGLKVDSLRQAIAAINPDVQVNPVARRADDSLLDTLVATADVVLDCSDNFATRHAINRACVRHQKPLVSGAAMRFDGQVAVYDTRDAASPCYACVFPDTEQASEADCATMGIFSPLVGIVGAVQAAEALKLLCAVGQPLTGRLLMLDGKSMQWTEMLLSRNAMCPTCSPRSVEKFENPDDFGTNRITTPPIEMESNAPGPSPSR